MSDNLFNWLLVLVFSLVAAFVLAGAMGAFDAVPNHPQPCPAVWRVDCEAAK